MSAGLPAEPVRSVESELLQMGLFGLPCAFLRQKVAGESRPLDPVEESDPDPVPFDERPWAVSKGRLAQGVRALAVQRAAADVRDQLFRPLYFAGSGTSTKSCRRPREHAVDVGLTRAGGKLRFESFQNRQGEFLAVLAPGCSRSCCGTGFDRSKKVEDPHSKTGT